MHTLKSSSNCTVVQMHGLQNSEFYVHIILLMSVNFVIQMSVPRYEFTMHEAALVYSCMHGCKNSKFDICINFCFLLIL